MLYAVKSPAQPTPVNLLTAFTALALAAKIHGTDKAVMQTAYQLLNRVNLKYQQLILSVLNSPSPLRHMTEFLIQMPDHILSTRIQ